MVTGKWQKEGRIGSKAGEAMALKGTSNITLSNQLLPFHFAHSFRQRPEERGAVGE